MIDGRLLYAKDAPLGVRLFSAREMTWGTLQDAEPRGRAFHFEGSRPRILTAFPADVFFLPADPGVDLGAAPFSWTNASFREAGRSVGCGVRIKWPDDRDLLGLVATSGYREACKVLGASDDALRVRVRKVRQRVELVDGVLDRRTQ